MVLDIIAAIVLIWGLITGFRKGLLQSVFFLIGIGLGLITALKMSEIVSHQLDLLLDIPTRFLPIISFVLIFAITVGIIIMLGNWIESVLKFLKLNIFNRIAGAVMWMLLSVFILSTCYWYGVQYGLITDKTIDGSVVYPYVAEVSPYVMEEAGQLAPALQNLYDSIEGMIKETPATKV